MHQTKHDMKKPSYGRWLLGIGGGVVALAIAGVLLLPDDRPRDGQAPVVRPSGRSDASHVLDPGRFRDPRQQQAYGIARQIPAVLNQLYCWCGCKENPRFRHRSVLECYESEHASQCDICIGEAEIAHWALSQGTTDIRTIQEHIDLRFGPRRPG